jgi:hypothetical protein
MPTLDPKTVLVLALNAVVLYLTATGKFHSEDAKAIVIWTLGPFIAGQSLENSAKHLATARAASNDALVAGLTRVATSLAPEREESKDTDEPAKN